MDKVEIGAVIKARRKKLNLTQAELAERIGTSQQNIPNIERGITNFTIDQLNKLCDKLELELKVFPKRNAQ